MRRRRLWELPAVSHDWLVALSLPPEPLKRLVERVLSRVKRAPVRLQGRESDVLYSVVHDLASRNAVSEAVEQALQLRHAAAVRASAALDGPEALRAHWCSALAQSEPAALVATAWALLTHPSAAEIEQALLYDARALGFAWARCGQRAALDPARAQAARALDSAALQAERERTQALQQRLSALHAERECERRAQAEALAALRGELQRWRHQAEALEAAARRVQAPPAAAGYAAVPAAVPAAPRAACERRPAPAPGVGGRGAAACARSTVPPAGLPVLAMAAARPDPEARQAAKSPPALWGRRVLCVGGMPGARERYRALVESAGARFSFHDGGLEQSVQRLDGQLDAADLVVCQAGCLNHEAYRRVKGHCRRAGKPCLFVDRPSLASFARTLGLGPAQEAPAGA